MDPRPISATDAENILGGVLARGAAGPTAFEAGREEHEPLTELLMRIRSEAVTTEAAPSAALAAWFEAPAVTGDPPRETPPVPGTGHRRMLVRGSFAGVGLAAKIAIGGAVAGASFVSAGAVAVLPPAAQHVFDDVVANVVPREVQQFVRGAWSGSDAAGRQRGGENDAKQSTPPDSGEPRTPEAPASGSDQPGKSAPPVAVTPGGPEVVTPGKAGGVTVPPVNPVPPTNPGPPTSPGPPANDGAPADPAPAKSVPVAPRPAKPQHADSGAPVKPDAPASRGARPPQGPAAPLETPGNAGEVGWPVDSPGKGRP